MPELILREPNSEVEAISSHLGFFYSLYQVFICLQATQEVKRGTWCQVSEWCNEGLRLSQGLFMYWQI